MKLFAENYTFYNPAPKTFNNVYIEDVSILRRRKDNYLAIGFEMYFMDGEDKKVIGNLTMFFKGLESDPDEKTTNKTAWMSYPNPDYDPQDSESQERFTVKLMDYITANGINFPEGYSIDDYGYPTYEKAKEFFTGGDSEQEQIILADNPLAIGFIMNKMKFFKEPVGVQFSIVEE